jgi:hypothetical protein
MRQPTIRVVLQAWLTPNYVRVAGGDTVVPLKSLDADELSAQCDRFRAEVFQKAGKFDPRVQP